MPRDATLLAMSVFTDQDFVTQLAERLKATTALVRQWVKDSKPVPETIAAANARGGNASGVVNALVVLREVPPEALRANSAELLPLLEQVKGNGPQTAALAQQVRDRAALTASAP
jgi:hypothetical protein